jgi:hypothetical protein
VFLADPEKAYMVTNIHERLIRAPLTTVGSLIDRLASRDDVMWPADRWPPVRFDRPLAVGARGGHGFVRYTVEAYEPGRSIRFRFAGPRGFTGTHGFDVEEIVPGMTRLRHVLILRLQGRARLAWPLAIRWLHDALIEDALDCAESYAASVPAGPREWSLWVRLLRRLARPSTQRAIAKSRERAPVAHR